jgi:hypothetical protein
MSAQTAKPAPHPAPPHHVAAKAIARFGDWQVAVHQEAGAPVCYAFVRARSTSLIIPGRGDVVLTVTQRPGARPAVAITTGFKLSGHLDGVVQAGADKLAFYIAGRSAFARHGQDAAAAFATADRALARFPAPKGGEVTDSFSLKGFSAAFARLGAGCPAP